VDFYRILSRITKNGERELYPEFVIGRSKDLMVRGRSFYAIWDEEAGFWSRDEYDVQRIVDDDLQHEADEQKIRKSGIKFLRNFNSQGWTQFKKFIAQIGDNSHQLDSKIT
jgi:hypothetical protein